MIAADKRPYCYQTKGGLNRICSHSSRSPPTYVMTDIIWNSSYSQRSECVTRELWRQDVKGSDSPTWCFLHLKVIRELSIRCLRPGLFFKTLEPQSSRFRAIYRSPPSCCRDWVIARESILTTPAGACQAIGHRANATKCDSARLLHHLRYIRSSCITTVKWIIGGAVQ